MNPELIKQLEIATQSSNALLMTILIISFSIIVLLIMIIGWFVVRQLRQIEQNRKDIEDLKNHSLNGDNEIKQGLQQLKESFKRLISIIDIWMKNPNLKDINLEGVRENL